MSMINVAHSNGLELVSLENGKVRATFIPQIGGKMIELRNLATDTQFLLEPRDGFQNIKHPSYGDPFGIDHAYGFDECFPTVEASINPENTVESESAGVEFPDHGELWSRPWKYEIKGEELLLHTFGVQSDYVFRKSVCLNGKRITFNYFIKSFSEAPLPFLWSAHPLLRVEPGVKLILPKSVVSVLLNSASDEKIGKYGDVLPWPRLSADGNDFSVVKGMDASIAVKCFTEKIGEEGRAIVQYPKSGESLAIQFKPTEIPYLGIWLTYGGWPSDSKEKQLAVAIEPATGRPDSLQKAFERDEFSFLRPGTEGSWSWSIELSDSE